MFKSPIPNSGSFFFQYYVLIFSILISPKNKCDDQTGLNIGPSSVGRVPRLKTQKRGAYKMPPMSGGKLYHQ